MTIERSPPPTGPAPPAGASRLPHVLVADDQSAVREFLAEVLKQAGYRATLVADGEEALECARRDPPQVVLTDLSMTPLGGLELIAQLRRAAPAAVAIVLTGYGTVEKAVELMRAGAFSVLTKPCSLAEISITVAKALEHHQALFANQDLRERLRVQDKLAMIGKLAAGVAHELNNPLDATLRCMRLLRSRVEGDASAEPHVAVAGTTC